MNGMASVREMGREQGLDDGEAARGSVGRRTAMQGRLSRVARCFHLFPIPADPSIDVEADRGHAYRLHTESGLRLVPCNDLEGHADDIYAGLYRAVGKPPGERPAAAAFASLESEVELYSSIANVNLLYR